MTVSYWLGRCSRQTPSSLSASLVLEGGTRAMSFECDSNSTGVNIELPILPRCFYLSLILRPGYIIPRTGTGFEFYSTLISPSAESGATLSPVRVPIALLANLFSFE